MPKQPCGMLAADKESHSRARQAPGASRHPRHRPPSAPSPTKPWPSAVPSAMIWEGAVAELLF